jgi:hypothetical protein
MSFAPLSSASARIVHRQGHGLNLISGDLINRRVTGKLHTTRVGREALRIVGPQNPPFAIPTGALVVFAEILEHAPSGFFDQFRASDGGIYIGVFIRKYLVNGILAVGFFMASNFDSRLHISGPCCQAFWQRFF